MKSVIFSFATHNHQPIGNFDNIIEEAYQHSYKPFFDIAERYPDARFGTHYTGILLDWLKAKHPEYIAQIQYLVGRGQLEIISGGFYEPILSVIPAADQQAQIGRLSTAIRETFNYDPSGMWLAERVWEQSLAKTLHQAGIKFVFLDDTHFISAGLRESDLNGYYMTEDEGHPLAVFPISKDLRYTIPFSPVDETLRVLRDAASEAGDTMVCFADDGEKFGVWPRTYDHVYQQGWLEEFFRKLVENRSWLKMMHGAEIVRSVKPKGRIYLPNASYAEMLQWALPSTEAYQRYEDFHHLLADDEARWGKYMQFVRGGYWRNFFVKYPESNHLHKHILRTSTRLNRLKSEGKAVDEAYTHLLTSECNDPFWHGVFGGIYLANLRHANYTELVKADRALDGFEQDQTRVSVEDFDLDGRDEVIVETKEFSLYAKPDVGGMLTELDHKPSAFNALNIVNRREEAYHAKITNATSAESAGGTKSIHDIVETKEANLEQYLVYDWYRHGSMLEHFIGPNENVYSMAQMKFEEQGDFLRSEFGFQTERLEDGMVLLRQERLGNVWQNTTARPVRLTKSLLVGKDDGALELTYRIENVSNEPLSLRLASEWTFNMLAGDAHDRYYRADGREIGEPKMRSTGVESAVRQFSLVDEFLKLKISLSSDEPIEFWRYPIETVSLSEAGFERVYQGSVVLPRWDIALGPSEVWERKLTVRFETLP